MPPLFAQPIHATTRYCAVYGHPIRHSASPAMQNAGLAALGLNWRYLAFEVRPEQLREAVAGAQAMRFIGLNLTVPHKLLAVELVDVLDASARQWGAVNTIRFEGRDEHGQWRPLADFADALPGTLRTQGFNTDADAITRSLREDVGVDTARARILLLGAGGAGRTAAFKLAADGCPALWLVNRTAAKAEAVAEEIARHYPGTQCHIGYPSGPVDLLLNATSLGLRADDPLPLATGSYDLAQAGAVYDMIYRPAETPLLQAARAAGCRTANGLGMLLYQGVKALEIWTGRPGPVEIMREALLRHVYV